MNVGDRISFKTRSWPEGILCVEIDPTTGQRRDVTGQGLYSGRGRIVGIDGDIYAVRQDSSDRIVEVGSHPDDQIRPLGSNYTTLNLGHLRAFLKQHNDAPDDIRVTISLPMRFFSDSEEMPTDHPEYKAVSSSQAIEACGIRITGFSQYGGFADRYIPPAERKGLDWDFSAEITLHPEQCFEALRGYEDDYPLL